MRRALRRGSDAERSRFASPHRHCQPDCSPCCNWRICWPTRGWWKPSTAARRSCRCVMGAAWVLTESAPGWPARATELRGLLERLEGCVEMGVRIVPSRDPRLAVRRPLRHCAAAALAPRNAGAAYLAARRTNWPSTIGSNGGTGRARSGCAPLARECVVETAAPGASADGLAVLPGRASQADCFARRLCAYRRRR